MLNSGKLLNNFYSTEDKVTELNNKLSLNNLTIPSTGITNSSSSVNAGLGLSLHKNNSSNNSNSYHRKTNSNNLNNSNGQKMNSVVKEIIYEKPESYLTNSFIKKDSIKDSYNQHRDRNNRDSMESKDSRGSGGDRRNSEKIKMNMNQLHSPTHDNSNFNIVDTTYNTNQVK